MKTLKIGESTIVTAEREFKFRVSFAKMSPTTYVVKAGSLKEAMDELFETLASHEKWTGKYTGIEPL